MPDRELNEQAQALLVLCRSKRLKIAAAESCTGGALAHRLTNVPGASEVFLSGFVTYANAAKTRDLGVEPALLVEHGAVSEAVARAIAIAEERTTVIGVLVHVDPPFVVL